MPRMCCVSGCNSNYRKYLNDGGEYINVFTFPKDPELRRKWIAAIHREESFAPTNETVVCANHFHTSQIIRVDCDSCKKIISSNDQFSVEFSSKTVCVSDYLIHLTRGALKTPSQFVFQFVIDAFKIFSLLLSADYEREFSTNLQRSIIKKLIILKTLLKILKNVKHTKKLFKISFIKWPMF